MEYNCKEADTHKQGILTPIFVIEFQRDVWLGQHKKLYINGPTLAKIPINTRRALLASIYVMELYKRQWYQKGTLLGGSGGGFYLLSTPFYLHLEGGFGEEFWTENVQKSSIFGHK